MISEGFPQIRIFGNPQDCNGYGHATQNICKALSDSKIPAKFVFSGPNKDFADKLTQNAKSPKVDLYIQTPPFKKHRSNNYKIGYFYWEADLLPKVWASDISKSLDEVWVPCELTRRSCILAGFKKRIEILPTPAKPPVFRGPIQLSGHNDKLRISDDTFKFYSVFQWNQRKGYNKLIRAYYEEFSEKENVVLILKVNPIKHALHGLPKIKRDIIKIRSSVFSKKRSMPKILLITERLSEEHLSGLHHSCDAFVLPHRGEGWGMPIHDAINHQNFIITTKFGGITEWLTGENSFLIDHNLTKVTPMNWNPWYAEYQSWANPSLTSLKILMRNCFDKRKEFDYKRTNLLNLSKKFTIKECSNNLEKILSQNRFKSFF